jgi:hypothetical protein
MQGSQEMALEELQRRSKRPRSALHDLIKEEPQRTQSALRGLLDAIPEQPQPSRHQSALRGLIDGNN